MPTVKTSKGVKHFPYTAKGKAAAKAATKSPNTNTKAYDAMHKKVFGIPK